MGRRQDNQKISLLVKPRIYAKGYFTPGVHSQPRWFAEAKYEFVVDFPRGLLPEGLNLGASEDEFIFSYSTDKGYGSPQEAVAALKALLPAQEWEMVIMPLDTEPMGSTSSLLHQARLEDEEAKDQKSV